MIQDMGPMESAQDGEDSDSDGYTTVDREIEKGKTAHQFVPYIARKPGLCAYCKGVLIGERYHILHVLTVSKIILQQSCRKLYIYIHIYIQSLSKRLSMSKIYRYT